MYNILSKVNNIDDLKKLTIIEMKILANEIRDFLIKNISETGGHLASNLGVVELTLALHKVFDSPTDKIIWDVGHQSYVHKILTGRKDKFHTLRQFNGLSGFPKRHESVHDIFETGHSSTSVSAGIGIALARDLKGEKSNIISVIGDGAMTAGMAYEALNHAGHTKKKLIVVLNDNNMSISKNVGSISSYLDRLRTANSYTKMKEDIENVLNGIPGIGKKLAKIIERIKDSIKYFFIPGSIFEELGFKYLGPINGHDIESLLKAFEIAKKLDYPILLHIVTKKGKGYLPAEIKPDKFHGVSPFNIETGEPKFKKSNKTYSDILGETLVKLAQENEKICTITAAMPIGTGLTDFIKKYPDRLFDVGIAEQHGVTLAAGLASQGLRPFYAVYSTFLQRGYDQILHDVCLQNLPVVFAIDRAGIVGNDGETHHGIYDISYLSHIPNITIITPKDKTEFIKMIEFSSKHNGPIAIRYPRGVCYELKEEFCYNEIKLGKGEILKEGKNIAFIAIGNMVKNCLEAAEILESEGFKPTVINARFIKPIDKELIIKLSKSHKIIVTAEDNCKIGGFGSLVNQILFEDKFYGETINFAFPDRFIEHGNINELFKKYQMDTESIVDIVKKRMNKINDFKGR